MTCWTITINSEAARRKAHEAVRRAPPGYRVTFQEPKRTVEQNSKMWAMLTDISRQLDYYGEKLPPESWKDIFAAALVKELKVVPSLDGKSFVQVGLRTSRMSKAEMADLIELIAQYGAMHGVRFSDEEDRAA